MTFKERKTEACRSLKTFPPDDDRAVNVCVTLKGRLLRHPAVRTAFTFPTRGRCTTRGSFKLFSFFIFLPADGLNINKQTHFVHGTFCKRGKTATTNLTRVSRSVHTRGCGELFSATKRSGVSVPALLGVQPPFPTPEITWFKCPDKYPRHQVRGVAQTWLPGDVDYSRPLPVLRTLQYEEEKGGESRRTAK